MVRRPEVDAGATWPGTIPPLLRRVYAARGATTQELARPRLAGLLPPDSLQGLDAATALLRQAMAEDRHIVVVGDFDCDGATACATGV
ncbi:MAG TPA: single-stranded-DNA-specific exonuclease RecJ, partial [Pseudoxanthomonas sp.]|nr:single-stranded-DNA-specific exonuclease RecJ [Pseudoxanthomonas sp.]